jgi:hypothetical protein
MGVKLTGLPASWLMLSDVSVKSLERRDLAVEAKLAALGLANRYWKAFAILVAWMGRRQRRTGVGVKAEALVARSSTPRSSTSTGAAREVAARARERMVEVNFILNDWNAEGLLLL